MSVNQSIIDILAPTGILWVAINLTNFSLVLGTCADGTPDGVSPDVARRIASALDLPCEFVLFEGPGQLADTVHNDVWDTGNIAIEQARAESIEISHEMFRQGKTDVLASLKLKLLNDMSSHDDYRIVEPSFTGIQQAVGIAKHRLDHSGLSDTGVPAMGFINGVISEMI